MYGPHPQLIAAELGVTTYLVKVRREMHPVPPRKITMENYILMPN
jgi:hypothetical protein